LIIFNYSKVRKEGTFPEKPISEIRSHGEKIGEKAPYWNNFLHILQFSERRVGLK
jgi:hypothetical protein